MFPSFDQSHSFKYPHPDYESESTEPSSYSSLHKPSAFPREPHFYTPPHPKDTSCYSKDSSFYSRDTTFYSRDSMPFNRKRGPYCKEEEVYLDSMPSKKLFVEDPSERYRAKTTSFMDRRPEFMRETPSPRFSHNTINFSNVNSLTHFQRKSPNMNVKLQTFDSLKFEDSMLPMEEDLGACFAEGKTSRGLKLLSIRVREFVIKHKETTYKEIAEQLLKEMKRNHKGLGDSTKEEQNIKRRIYDALNVLVATDIFKKRGKTVYYDGHSSVMGHDLMNKRALVDKEDLLEKIVNLLNVYEFWLIFLIYSKRKKKCCRRNRRGCRPFW